MNKIELGNLGENYAAQFLKTFNYHILTTNYRTRQGEIDLVAITPDLTLAFIEVKTRSNSKFGQAEQAINHKKKQRLIHTALHFLSQSREKHYSSWRIDLVAVKLNSQYQLQEINHYKNIFDG